VRRAIVLVVLALGVVAALAGCGGGGSGEQTASADGGTITIPEGVHGVYGEIAALLDQFPYQPWFTRCVVAKFKKQVGPAEAKELDEVTEASTSSKEQKVLVEARTACEKSPRSLIDPNASEEEFARYRAGYVQPLREAAEAKKFSTEGVACVEKKVEELTTAKVLALGNGSAKLGEVILLAILSTCAKAE
jgi:hypothetical protein